MAKIVSKVANSPRGALTALIGSILVLIALPNFIPDISSFWTDDLSFSHYIIFIGLSMAIIGFMEKKYKCSECGNPVDDKEVKICPTCGAKMRAAAPLKFSPEDRQGERRRQRKEVESGNWAASLPSIKENGGEEE